MDCLLPYPKYRVKWCGETHLLLQGNRKSHSEIRRTKYPATPKKVLLAVGRYEIKWLGELWRNRVTTVDWVTINVSSKWRYVVLIVIPSVRFTSTCDESKLNIPYRTKYLAQTLVKEICDRAKNASFNRKWDWRIDLLLFQNVFWGLSRAFICQIPSWYCCPNLKGRKGRALLAFQLIVGTYFAVLFHGGDNNCKQIDERIGQGTHYKFHSVLLWIQRHASSISETVLVTYYSDR